MLNMTDFNWLHGDYPLHVVAVAGPPRMEVEKSSISEERRKAIQDGRKQKSTQERKDALDRLQKRFDGFFKDCMFSPSTFVEAYNGEKGTTIEIAREFVQSLIERGLIEYKPIPGRKGCRKL